MWIDNVLLGYLLISWGLRHLNLACFHTRLGHICLIYGKSLSRWYWIRLTLLKYSHNRVFGFHNSLVSHFNHCFLSENLMLFFIRSWIRLIQINHFLLKQLKIFLNFVFGVFFDKVWACRIIERWNIHPCGILTTIYIRIALDLHSLIMRISGLGIKILSHQFWGYQGRSPAINRRLCHLYEIVRLIKVIDSIVNLFVTELKLLHALVSVEINGFCFFII